MSLTRTEGKMTGDLLAPPTAQDVLDLFDKAPYRLCPDCGGTGELCQPDCERCDGTGELCGGVAPHTRRLSLAVEVAA